MVRLLDIGSTMHVKVKARRARVSETPDGCTTLLLSVSWHGCVSAISDKQRRFKRTDSAPEPAHMHEELSERISCHYSTT